MTNQQRPVLGFLVGVLAVVLALSFPVQADTTWVRMATPRFELYTNLSEHAGRQTLAWFEQAHQAITSELPAGQRSTRPVRIYLFASEEDFEPYRASEVSLGYALRGRDRSYVAIQFSGPATRRIIVHEYVHLVLQSMKFRMPHWLEEGTAEFYSNLGVFDSRLYAGLPAADHVMTLTRLPLLDAETFRAVDGQVPYQVERYRTGVFYSQSWGLVHMLTMQPGYRERFPAFTAMIRRGTDPEQAFEAAFGKSLEEAFRDLAAYVNEGRIQAMQLRVAPIRWLQISPTRRLSDEEIAPVLEELLSELNSAR